VLHTPRMLMRQRHRALALLRRTLLVRPFIANSTVSRRAAEIEFIRTFVEGCPRSAASMHRARCVGYLASAEYSALGSMFVAIAIRLVRLYIAAISATSHASSSVSPASSSVCRSARSISRGVSVSFSA
jgi:hypothetical protein